MSERNRRQSAWIIKRSDDEQHRGRRRTEDAALVMDDVVQVGERQSLTVG